MLEGSYTFKLSEKTMSFTLLLVIGVALLLVTLAVNGGFLWVGCKCLKVEKATYRRCLGAVLLISLIGCSMSLLSYLFSQHALATYWSLVFLSATIVISLVCLKILLRTSTIRAFLAGLIWKILELGYVVILVIIIRQTLAQAFVVPTGGMAETIRGYHKMVTCPQCQHLFAINASSEAGEQGPKLHGLDKLYVRHCICPNCSYQIDFQKDGLAPSLDGGDRILIAKSSTEQFLRKPEPFDVVTFSYPPMPIQNGEPIQYVERLIGLPEATIGIYRGDLYVGRNFDYTGQRQPENEEDRYKREYMYENDAKVVEVFRKQVENRFEPVPGLDEMKFEILRKDPERILALRHLVHDNDFQAKDLSGKQPPRWTIEAKNTAWKTDDSQQPRRFVREAGAELSWLRYHHLQRESGKPGLITDFIGYNNGRLGSLAQNWVGDLILECEATIEKPEGKLVLDLAKGVDRFQARWDLSSGMCTLVRISRDKEEKLAEQPTELSKSGSFRLRFANVDERLIVWVGDKLPFGAGVTYLPPRERGPYENDLQPAGIGASNPGLTIAHVQLWRDTYYTTARHEMPNNADAESGDWSFGSESWHDPVQWGPLQNLPVKTLYVQPGHYLVLGDNSPESSDSRMWGSVPERLLVGRAVGIYYPCKRFGPIR